MAGQVLAVASGKGGVGKTTTVVNLGVVLRRADHTVALVDADLGMANLDTMLGIDAEATIHDVLAGRSTVEAAVVEEAPGFVVLAGSGDLSSYPDADPRALGEVLEALAASYDYVLVDTGAGMSHEDVLPLGLADRVILVTSPDPAAIGDTRKTAELAGLAEGAIAGLLVTKAEESTDAADVAAQVGVTLLGVVPFDAGVRSSTASATPLEAADPDGPAAAAYRELGSLIAADAPASEAAERAEPTAEAAEAPEPTPADDPGPEGATDTAGSDPADEPEAAPDEAEPADAAVEADGEPADEAATADDGGEAAPADATTSPEPADEAGAEEAPGAVESAEPADDGDGDAEPGTEDADEEAGEDEGEAAEAADGVDEPVEAEDAAADPDGPEEASDDDAEAEAADAPEADEAREGESAEADDEDEEDLDDYLEEFEDIEPERSGGFFSRLRRLFR